MCTYTRCAVDIRGFVDENPHEHGNVIEVRILAQIRCRGLQTVIIRIACGDPTRFSFKTANGILLFVRLPFVGEKMADI